MRALSSRLVRSGGLAAILAGLWFNAAPAHAQPASAAALGGAETFAVLGGASVTNSGASSFAGDVGVGPGGTLTGVTDAMLAPGSLRHTGTAVAAQALHDGRAAWTSLAGLACPPAHLNPTLDGASLAPGVYCFAADAALATTLTLTGDGPWIFQVSGALSIAAGASVVAPLVGAATCRGSNVQWQVGDRSAATPVTSATIGAGAQMVGSIVAEGAVTLGAGATLDGRAIALGAPDGTGGVVTVTNAAITACSDGQPVPTQPAFKVTGGGSIFVPSDPTITDPDATGSALANYGFEAQPAGTGAAGTLNYVNHAVNGNLHVNGSVTAVQVIAMNTDGTPRTVRLSGTCDGALPTCTFSVVTEDNGEPGVNDMFGVTIVSGGQVIEARSLRRVRNGNIQFHSASLTTSLNAPTLRGGQNMRVRARLRRDRTATASDAYVVLRLPNGDLLSWTTAGLVPGLAPLARNFVPIDFDGDILQLTIPPGAPPGVYSWMSALTRTGTLELLSGIAQRTFTVAP